MEAASRLASSAEVRAWSSANDRPDQGARRIPSQERRSAGVEIGAGEGEGVEDFGAFAEGDEVDGAEGDLCGAEGFGYAD